MKEIKKYLSCPIKKTIILLDECKKCYYHGGLKGFWLWKDKVNCKFKNEIVLIDKIVVVDKK